MELKDRIRRAREAAGMTQAELAERVGRDQKTVRNWEAGRIPRGSIGAIEKALGISLADDDDRSTSPRLDDATDAEVLASLANRLAERDRRIRELTAEVEQMHDGAAPSASTRWAARVREGADPSPDQ